jgi:Fe-S cluster assembly protein SufD
VKSGGKELALELEESGYAGAGYEEEEEAVGKRMTAVAEQTGAWLELFTRHATAPPSRGYESCARTPFGASPNWAFPTTHDEEWRFTNVAPIARTVPPLARGQRCCDAFRRRGTEHAAEREPYLPRYAAFEQNASYRAEHGLPMRRRRRSRFRAAVSSEPIEITYQPGPTPIRTSGAHPRTLIVVGAGRALHHRRDYKGAGKYFTNAVTEIVAGDGAVVDHYKVQRESARPSTWPRCRRNWAAARVLTTHSISLGGALVRNDVNATLSEGSDATLNGLYW